MICIFPALSIDTNNGHICGHIMPFHDSHYGHFDHFGYYGLTQYGPEYGHHWCLWKDQEKCRSTIKTESKKLQRLKSYGQIKIYDEIMTYFPSILAQNFNELVGPLRMLGFVSKIFGSSLGATEWDKTVAEIIHTVFVFFKTLKASD